MDRREGTEIGTYCSVEGAFLEGWRAGGQLRPQGADAGRLKIETTGCKALLAKKHLCTRTAEHWQAGQEKLQQPTNDHRGGGGAHPDLRSTETRTSRMLR